MVAHMGFPKIWKTLFKCIFFFPGEQVFDVRGQKQNLAFGNQTNHFTPQSQIDFFERLKSENDNLKLQMRQEMEAERKAFLDELQKSKTEQDTKVFFFEDLKRNFDQVSSELEQLKRTSKIEIDTLNSYLEEATANNKALESQLITMSENYYKFQQDTANGLEAEVTRLKHQSEQNQADLEESRYKIEGLYDVIRKKTVQISQMKLDEERLELELKKWRSYNVDYKSGAENFIAIKNRLEKVFLSDEKFCQNVIGTNNDKFENIDDNEICSIIEFILTDYVSTKEKSFANLQGFNKKIYELKSILLLRDERLKELTSKFNIKVNEVQSRMSDTKKMVRELEIATAERDKLTKKIEVSTEELRRTKDRITTLESGTKKLVRNLKFTLDQKEKIILDLEKKKKTLNSDVIKQQTETIENLKNIEIHLKTNLTEQRLKMKEQENMILVLQKSNLHLETAIKAPNGAKDLEKENLKLKEEINSQSNRFSLIFKNLDEMKKKVRTTLEEKEGEISKLEQQLQSCKTDCAKMRKQLETQVVDLV